MYHAEIVKTLDACAARLLFPLSILLLINALDDLVLVAACLWDRIRPRPTRLVPRQDSPERRLAVFVPAWHEHAVIAHMLEHNISAIRYSSYEFFVGAYPNDEATMAAIGCIAARYPRVHLALCPHPGPTSKADCLNWIYQRMLLYEEEHGVHFDVILTHDAEDLIHPDAFRAINRYAGEYGMIQVPVLALPTPAWEIVHGIYCDEFAEYQSKDVQARSILGSFLPSNGVGTGYTREALEHLALSANNRIFDPECLTEDYENGLRLHRLGCKQIFLPLKATNPVATREYFPRSWRSAVRQRTRWVMGICLQSWERNGWSGTWLQRYWFWRDRKGLLGNPASVLTNALFLWGAISWILAHAAGREWALARQAGHPGLLTATCAFQALHVTIRAACVARLYGLVFALGVPVRIVAANYLNASATVMAIARYAAARLANRPLVWLKTEHAYPNRAALLEHKRSLGEILVGCGYIESDVLERAMRTKPSGVRTGEHLLALGLISETDLYEALSLQHSISAGDLNLRDIPTRVARSLPRAVVQQWRVLPFRVAEGSLYVASPEIPTDELTQALRPFTRLEIRFQLITPANFRELTAALL